MGMIANAIEVRLKSKSRAVLEARLRAATTEQRMLLRIKIVLEAAEGTSTREIARELDTTPTTVSLWRGRYARDGIEGLDDLPRSGTPAIYDATTDQRIRKVLDKPPPKGFARWTGPLIAEALGDVVLEARVFDTTCNMSGAPCASRKSISAAARAGARATTLSLRARPPMWSAST